MRITNGERLYHRVVYVWSNIHTFMHTYQETVQLHRFVYIHPRMPFQYLSPTNLIPPGQALGRLEPSDLLWVAALPAAGEVRGGESP